MVEYRIYPLDRGGRIRAPAAVTHCGDDDGALALAQGSLEGSAQAEVWAGTRCLGRISRNPGEGQRPGCPPDIEPKRRATGW